MAGLLVIIGLLIWLFTVHHALGFVLLVIGLILFFVPAVPYGYSSWRGRRY